MLPGLSSQFLRRPIAKSRAAAHRRLLLQQTPPVLLIISPVQIAQNAVRQLSRRYPKRFQLRFQLPDVAFSRIVVQVLVHSNAVQKALDVVVGTLLLATL